MNALAAAGLSDEGGIFDLPDDLNAIDLINEQLQEATKGPAAKVFVLAHDLANEGEASVVELGAAAKIDSCLPIDVLGNGNALAFRVQSKLSGVSSCAALNPCAHTHGIGQTGIVPDVGIGGVLFMQLNAAGFNEMWDNTGPPEEIFVDGHVAVRGSRRLGLKLSSVIEVPISMNISLVIDVDPNDNGIENSGRVLNDQEEDDDDQEVSSDIVTVIDSEFALHCLAQC